jgi:hypothetical protein
MWKANGKTTTLQLFLDSLSPKNMRNASSGDELKIAIFGDLSLEEAMDLSREYPAPFGWATETAWTLWRR